jgi:voltage-gated potassium channel
MMPPGRQVRQLRRFPPALIRHIWWIVKHRVPPSLWRSILIPIVLLGIGTVSYPMIEGEPWTLFDGFYFTAITLTTIGYGELHPLSEAGRLFTVLLAYGGIFTLAYFMTELVRTVLTGELRIFLGRRRMEESLLQMENHLIVCGYGRMGKIICEELERRRVRFVVIDMTPLEPESWTLKFGIHLLGNATEDDVLRQAGIDRAKALITALASDADNLYITLSARLLNPNLTIIARAEEEEAESKLRKVGANKIISPYLAGGLRAVQAVLRPSILQFMEIASRADMLDLQIEEIAIEESSSLGGKSLKESRIAHDLGVVVVGIQFPDGELVYAPEGDTVIVPGAMLIALGHRRQLDRVLRLAKAEK